MIAIHGTTKTYVNQILNNKEKIVYNWSVSNDSLTYAWKGDVLLDNEQFSLQNPAHLNLALNQAYQAAITRMLIDEDYTCYVIFFDFPQYLMYDGSIADDDTAQGMQEVALCFDVEDIPNLHQYVAAVYACEVNPMTAPIYAKMLQQYDHCNHYEFPHNTLQASDLIGEVDSDHLEMYESDLDWIEVTDQFITNEEKAA